MNDLIEGIRRTCAVTVGAVFFIAGMLKLMDPVGAGLVASEYLKFFHMGALAAVSKPAAILLALTETLTGAALISGVWRRIAAWITLALLGIFTVITAILWALNPAMDCGCFGEAVHLTHFQSFAKNIVLLMLSAIAFIQKDSIFGPRPGKYAAFGMTAAAVLAFSIFSLRDIPLVDFTAFSPGCQLMDTWSSMEADADFDAGEPDTSLPILSIRDGFGEYVDQAAADGDVLVVSAYAPEKISQTGWSGIAEALEGAAAAGMRPILITPDIDNVPMTLGEYLCFSDIKTLMTLNRSNGGATWISDGIISAKWSSGKVPGQSELAEMADAGAADTITSRTSHRRIACEGIMLGCFALLLLL